MADDTIREPAWGDHAASPGVVTRLAALRARSKWDWKRSDLVTTQPPIMLYDGDCALCTGTVQFVLDHEKDSALHFAPLQSDLGRSYLKELGLAVDDFDSYVIVPQPVVSWARDKR